MISAVKLYTTPLLFFDMAMYPPKTWLAHGVSTKLQSCTVLTNGNVMVHKICGRPHREIMPLEDWIILAFENKIRGVLPDGTQFGFSSLEDYDTYSDEDVPPTHPYGTTLRWSGPCMSRTAVVLHDGILQIKEFLRGTISTKQKFFSSEEEWLYSLPDENVTVVEREQN